MHKSSWGSFYLSTSWSMPYPTKPPGRPRCSWFYVCFWLYQNTSIHSASNKRTKWLALNSNQTCSEIGLLMHVWLFVSSGVAPSDNHNHAPIAKALALAAIIDYCGCIEWLFPSLVLSLGLYVTQKDSHTAILHTPRPPGPQGHNGQSALQSQLSSDGCYCCISQTHSRPPERWHNTCLLVWIGCFGFFFVSFIVALHFMQNP